MKGHTTQQRSFRWAVGVNLRELRIRHKLSQVEVASQRGISQSAYSRWESGQTSPTLEDLWTLASVFQMDPDELVAELVDGVRKASLNVGSVRPVGTEQNDRLA